VPAATELDPALAWSHGPGTRFFSGDDGKYFIVMADLEDYSQMHDSITRQPTVILYTDENAGLADLDVDFSFPPGTSVEDAIAEAGYDIV